MQKRIGITMDNKSQDESKGGFSRGGETTKRRALGDITNAVKVEGPKDKISKKAVLQVQVQPSILQQPTLSHNVVVSSSSMNQMDQQVDENRTSMAVADEEDDRIYMQRPSDDIDARDAENPLLVTEYVDEMYVNFRASEARHQINSNYIYQQPHVNEKMRAILIDWLVEVHMKFKMVPETLYATVNYIDRYLETKQVRRSKLQLVGVAALLLAAKYEEIYPPELRELVYITDRAYNKEEILEMEVEIVNALHYNCTVPTAHTFLCRYLKAAHADRTMVQLACYLAERSLQEISSLKFLPSTIAATAILLARKTLRRHPWSPTLLRYTGFDECDIAACVQDMRGFLEINDACQQQAVFRKYSGPKFGAVAKLDIMF